MRLIFESKYFSFIATAFEPLPTDDDDDLFVSNVDGDFDVAPALEELVDGDEEPDQRFGFRARRV